jgi:hypothetical protein
MADAARDVACARKRDRPRDRLCEAEEHAEREDERAAEDEPLPELREAAAGERGVRADPRGDGDGADAGG